MKIENEEIQVEVSLHGAEMTRIAKKGKEYLWCGDAQYWGRHAPILFPIVGKVYDGKYRIKGKEYGLPQHGFARDMDFELKEQGREEVTMELASNEETKSRYPYPFVLSAAYRLDGGRIAVRWTVENRTETVMDYQIGAHPAFNYAAFDPEEERHGGLRLLRKEGDGYRPVEGVEVRGFSREGYATAEQNRIELKQGRMAMTDALFAKGALILENRQVQKAILEDKEGQPMLAMTFDKAPVLGIWSPEGKRAPFVCIEPWAGRCDREGYDGEFGEREWMNHLAPHSLQQFEYDIEIY